MDKAIIRTALSHLDERNTYVRMLFIDYSSIFNTIVPSKLITKFVALGLNQALCNWVLDIVTGRPQVVTPPPLPCSTNGGPTSVRAQPPPVLPCSPMTVATHTHHQVCKQWYA